MAEYINREELERLMCEQGDGVRLDDVPSIDIVHCKECKWAGRDDHCPAMEVYMICGDNGYCSCGEREEQEHD